jgi:hypothetical protein
MGKFEYDSELLARFPDVQAGVLFCQGISNQSTPVGLKEKYFIEQGAVLKQLGRPP